MADRYHRLITLIVEVCPKPLRKLFLKYAKEDFPKGKKFTIEAYINSRRHDLKIKSLGREQKNRLFNIKPVDIDDWDSTLVILLLTVLFESKTKPLIGHLQLIKEHRNTLLHWPSTNTMDLKQYNDIWGGLQDSTLKISKEADGEVYKKEINGLIDDTSVNNMPNLGDVTRKWTIDKILCFEKEIKTLQKSMSDVTTGTVETNRILKKTSWDKHTGKTGMVSMRWKTVNPKVKHMQEAFVATIATNNEVETYVSSLAGKGDKVIAHLEDKHYVVVAGQCDAIYTKVAFDAITKKNFPNDRCLRIDNPTDWRYVVRLDTDLVVFMYPFGKRHFDMEKAKLMSDLQDSILQIITYVPDESDKSSHVVNVVIVTDHAILNEYKSNFDHEIVADPVTVYSNTTEESPLDLTEGTNYNSHVYKNTSHSNFLAQSICYLKFKRENMLCPTQSKFRLAKNIFKTNKSLVITGANKCGKTSLAMSLLEAYEDCQCLILTEPGEVGFINLGETCVIVIEDFTGKHIFDPCFVEGWFRKFDLLLAAVTERKLNVIITSEENKFSQCCSEFQRHPILEHVIRLEADQSSSSPEPLMTEPPMILHGKEDSKVHFTIDRREKSEAMKGNTIHDICYSGDGTFIVDGFDFQKRPSVKSLTAFFSTSR